MSDEIRDGGPAFPVPVAQPFGDGHMAVCGLSVRDYFAAKSITVAFEIAHKAYMANQIPDYDTEHIANLSYAIADSMLAARERKPE